MPLVIHIANDVLNIALSMKILNFAKRVGEAKDAGIAGNDMYDAAADFGDWTESGFEELANGILAIGIIGLVYQLGLLAYFARAGAPTADDWQTILWVVFGAYLLDLPAACMTICYMKYDGQDALSASDPENIPDVRKEIKYQYTTKAQNSNKPWSPA